MVNLHVLSPVPFILCNVFFIDLDITRLLSLAQRQRTQVNGKIVEDGNTLHADSAMNGA